MYCAMHKLNGAVGLEALHKSELDPDGERERWRTAVGQGAQAMALEIHHAMVRYQEKRNSAPAYRAAIVMLLEALIRFTPLTVASLNWDDLPIRTEIDWYDGFQHDDIRGGHFDRKFLWEFAKKRYRLLWLHGSIHYNRPTLKELQDNSRDFAFRWIKDAEEAIKGWVQGFDGNDVGQLILRFPIITARRKPDQLFMRPFFDHWSALYQELLKTRALLVIGYSGHDAHLNSLLAEAMRYNPRLKTVIWINKTDGVVDLVEKQISEDLTKIFGDGLICTCHRNDKICNR